MNFEQYKIAFEKEASNSGYSLVNINKCLNYAEKLFAKKVPVIYNTSHLSALVGYRKDYLKRAVVYTPYYYRKFKIRKKNGKLREISEPLPSLKEIQSWILNNILNNIEISPFAKAYRKKISIIENVKYHKSQPKIVTLDLTDFFPSIKTKSIEEIFLNLGYSKLISNLLAKLCSKDDCLPQGAPTSPYLSNIYFKNADDLISKYCIENKIKYTRYADDLSFSGEFDELKLINVVNEIVGAFGLKLNNDKTKIMTPNTRQSVTGIVVNKKPQVVFHKRNILRQELYYIKKFGIEEHMKRMSIKKSNYLAHLLGRINFILQINPEDSEFIEYRKHLYSLRNQS